MIDHLGDEGLGWFRVNRGNKPWATALTDAAADTSAGFSDWFIPNVNQLFSLYNAGTTNPFNYTPINGFGSINLQFWTSTTVETATFRATIVNDVLNDPMGRDDKVNNRRMVICRNHYKPTNIKDIL